MNFRPSRRRTLLGECLLHHQGLLPLSPAFVPHCFTSHSYYWSAHQGQMDGNSYLSNWCSCSDTSGASRIYFALCSPLGNLPCWFSFYSTISVYWQHALERTHLSLFYISYPYGKKVGNLLRVFTYKFWRSARRVKVGIFEVLSSRHWKMI
jgi:hypothetical protein